MKNYYEILEVNKHASGEIIEKAYKVLIKKYHPDLYTEEDKLYAEQKTKDINEAYKVLSDSFLREQYDIEMQKEEMTNYMQKQQQIDKKQTNKNYMNKQKQSVESDTYDKQQKANNYKVGSFKNIVKILKDIWKNRKKLKDLEKIDVFALVLTIIILIILGIILWFIPFTNGWMRQLLFENPISQFIGKLFGG